MKQKYIFSIAFLFLFTFCLSAVDTFAQRTKSRAKASIRGENFSYKLYDEDFANTPSWNAEEGEPPVSISRAVQIAKANLARFVEGSDNFKVRSVHLRQFGSLNKWYYLIRYYCRGKECRNLRIRNFPMVVKMNETVVEPKLLPPDF